MADHHPGYDIIERIHDYLQVTYIATEEEPDEVQLQLVLANTLGFVDQLASLSKDLLNRIARLEEQLDV